MASGKGGTGKTTVSVNLALFLARSYTVSLFDLDVEEPNDNHFLQLEMKPFQKINILRPVIDESICTHCGVCAELCEYNALAVPPTQVMVFDNLCHGCGLCALACPENAIKEEPHELGVIYSSIHSRKNFYFYEGVLKVGEAIATPIIHEMKEIAFKDDSEFVILDLPPGSACPVIKGLSNSDYAVLVTEPTPAGEHDLRIAIEVVKELGIPFGIVNNRSDVGDDCIIKLVKENNYKLLLVIPHDTKILHLYSKGCTLIDTDDRYVDVFSTLWQQIERSLDE